MFYASAVTSTGLVVISHGNPGLNQSVVDMKPYLIGSVVPWGGNKKVKLFIAIYFSISSS